MRPCFTADEISFSELSFARHVKKDDNEITAFQSS